MTVLFDRRAELRLGSLVLSDLRFTFAVERGLRATPGKAEIHVFNLNEDHRRELGSLRSVPCELGIGYQDGTFSAFVGDLAKATSKYAAPDWDTKLEAADGGTGRREKRVQRSYRPGTKVEVVLGDVVDALGIGRGNLAEAVRVARLSGAGADFVAGTVLSGSASDALERISQTLGLEVSTQNATAQFLPIRAGLPGEVFVLEQANGLVGDVELDAKTGAIKFRTLICPQIVPARIVEPRTRTVSGGHYRVTKCTWKGDTHGTDWYAECDAEPQGSRRAA